MTWDAELEALMTQTVVVSTGPTSRANLSGVASFSTSGSTYKARVVHKPEQVRVGADSVVEAKAVAWVASTTAISREHRVTIPSADGSGTESPPVLAVEQYPDEDGRHHHKILFGW